MNIDYPDADTSQADVLRDLNALVISKELRKVERLLADFNLFRVLRFEDGEIRHSNVLAWLLQPDESHGLKDGFLRRWLMRIHNDASDIKPQLSPVVLDALSIRAIDVRREWSTGTGFLDLLIRIQNFNDEEWVIAIENKVGAEQSPGQLEGYRTAVERAFPNATHRLFVFLSRRDQEPADHFWLKTNYTQVREELDSLLKEQAHVIGQEPAVLIRHYIDIINEASMSKNQIAEIARMLYKNHRPALEAIFEHRPDYVRDLSNLLAEHLRKEAVVLKLSPMLCGKYWVRFLPEDWDKPENRKGTAWGQDGSAYILCQLTVGEGSAPSLAIVEGQSPIEWRDKLWSLSKAKKFPIRQERKKQAAKSMTIYTVAADFTVIEKESPDKESPDTGAMAAKVWDWVKEEIQKRQFCAAVHDIAEHIKAWCQAWCQALFL